VDIYIEPRERTGLTLTSHLENGASDSAALSQCSTGGLEPGFCAQVPGAAFLTQGHQGRIEHIVNFFSTKRDANVVMSHESSCECSSLLLGPHLSSVSILSAHYQALIDVNPAHPTPERSLIQCDMVAAGPHPGQ